MIYKQKKSKWKYISYSYNIPLFLNLKKPVWSWFRLSYIDYKLLLTVHWLGWSWTPLMNRVYLPLSFSVLYQSYSIWNILLLYVYQFYIVSCVNPTIANTNSIASFSWKIWLLNSALIYTHSKTIILKTIKFSDTEKLNTSNWTQIRLPLQHVQSMLWSNLDTTWHNLVIRFDTIEPLVSVVLALKLPCLLLSATTGILLIRNICKKKTTNKHTGR